MHIESFKATDTDLGRFLEFCDKIKDSSISVKKEDWHVMCSITITQNIGNGYGVNANFSHDGSIRVISSLKDFQKNEQYKDIIKERIKYMSLWEFIKRKLGWM